MSREETFLGTDWLLDTRAAVFLYRDTAVPERESVGVIDTHTHHNLRQIVENHPFPNIWRAEVLEDRPAYANSDHYIIQLAAKLPGFSQAFARDPEIADRDKWLALSRVFPELEGNHVHQWLHLDLRRMFGIDQLLCEQTGEEIWRAANERLKTREMLPQSVLKKIRAKVVFTTDDPADDLHDHDKAAVIKGLRFLPTFRPDAYCRIFSEGWRQDVKNICRLTGKEPTLKGLVEALQERHDYFAEHGARASDHGLLEPYGRIVSEKRAKALFDQAYHQKQRCLVQSVETGDFVSYLMHRFCEMNRERGMVTQLHYGAWRDANEYLHRSWGADVGGDIVLDSVHVVRNIQPLLSRFFSGESPEESHLVLYPMNQAHAHVNVMLERAYPRVHSGFPWWHNDTPFVMEQYLLHTAGASLLTSSGGPVCDGRKILSVGSRFEVFDRVICRAVGRLMTDGQISASGAPRLVKALMAGNQKRLYGLD